MRLIFIFLPVSLIIYILANTVPDSPPSL
ncbi:hypothetical protein [Virgibacillus ihumii]